MHFECKTFLVQKFLWPKVTHFSISAERREAAAHRAEPEAADPSPLRPGLPYLDNHCIPLGTVWCGTPAPGYRSQPDGDGHPVTTQLHPHSASRNEPWSKNHRKPTAIDPWDQPAILQKGNSRDSISARVYMLGKVEEIPQILRFCCYAKLLFSWLCEFHWLLENVVL